MRFKAKFTADGTDQLEKRFLPAMEKFGKTIQVLLSEEEVKLVQTPLDTDGAQVMASFPIEALFDRSSYRCTSRHHNLIAFVADVGLLLKVIRTAAANVAEEGLEVKLSQKEFQVTGTEESEAKPFLVFKGEGQTMSILQELPISKPYTAEEIDHLVNLATTASLAPYYVDVGPCSTTLLAMIDRMKSVSGTLMMARMVMCM
ncbi:hypothetical protein CEUSTIGMA_g1323.t1 [Chlamydomonas eustigma]|uniref:Proliferating cell nuclear antigen PCNA N-terminal domain-containing protein n=1 Tax=Chlamydomonas eustigma TaxID=1157962 RepID=A0A250WSS7_9CHLO|nr:hypothetical protein CEUSTIGMA_g1323.t1 [Chlamydomonas eustigma]|eukprot:GAX73873.1 hypothetical protein CEUSTIGMA_g1323.t1 [Chlamydomonas eustigma]